MANPLSMAVGSFHSLQPKPGKHGQASCPCHPARRPPWVRWVPLAAGCHWRLVRQCPLPKPARPTGRQAARGTQHGGPPPWAANPRSITSWLAESIAWARPLTKCTHFQALPPFRRARKGTPGGVGSRGLLAARASWRRRDAVVTCRRVPLAACPPVPVAEAGQTHGQASCPCHPAPVPVAEAGQTHGQASCPCHPAPTRADKLPVAPGGSIPVSARLVFG